MTIEEATEWRVGFDERQLKEIEFCRIYTRQFAHGTDGHNWRLLVAKMADLLEEPAFLHRLATQRQLSRLYETDPDEYYRRVGATLAVSKE